jgi:hypothetical protein
MISYSIDDSGRIVTLSYSHHVTPREVQDCLDGFRDRTEHLQSCFVVLADLTNLDSMDPDCADGLGAFMELASESGMTVALRVIPDPSKDIGLNLISQFHYRKPVRTYTLPNLAEALKVLLELEEAERCQPAAE